MNYARMGPENIEKESRIFKGSRPRLVTCAAFAVAVLLIVTSAIGIGLVMGYTYCYLEYRSAFRSVTGNGNASEATNIVHIVQFSQPDIPDSGNRSINHALSSSVFISRILHFGQALMKQEENFLAWVNDKPDLA